jgi:hypothetical protein
VFCDRFVCEFEHLGFVIKLHFFHVKEKKIGFLLVLVLVVIDFFVCLLDQAHGSRTW